MEELDLTISSSLRILSVSLSPACHLQWTRMMQAWTWIDLLPD